ncbi:MAG: sugar kinase, partial [Candidatus Rokubacteria bacterium]|nr:sugar kinase [Candidatus Rokubacteria bacterium]
MSAPDFVAIGHITLDRFGDVVRPGGAALYAAVTAARMGLSAGILTSVASDYPLEAIPPDIEVIATPSPASTVFEYETGPSGRVMRVRTRARPLSPAD